MLVLLDKSPRHIKEYSQRYEYEFGQLRTPLTKNALAGVPYGLDNGCYSGVLPDSWYRLLGEAEKNRPLFVAMPDIVGSAQRTMDLFWHFELLTNGLPRALVLQDGVGKIPIPWEKIDAVFIGGTDTFKISTEAFDAAKCARLLGKWVHVGRVNDIARAANWWGFADSIDGSGLSRFDHSLEKVLNFIRSGPSQESIDFQ